MCYGKTILQNTFTKIQHDPYVIESQKVGFIKESWHRRNGARSFFVPFSITE